MASLSNRKIEEHNAGTQSESSSEAIQCRVLRRVRELPRQVPKADTKLAWHLMTFNDMCMSNLLVCHAKLWNP